MIHLQFAEIPQPFNKRIELARNNSRFEPNCYGTAFFLLGVLPYDMVIYTGKGLIRSALNRMNVSSSPQIHSIMVSCDKDDGILHTSYIETAAPLTGYQRRGSEGEFTRVNSLSDVEDYLKSLSPESFFGGASVKYKHNYFTLREGDSLKDWAEKIVAQYHPDWYD